MGEIQLEILQRMIRERFGLEVAFGPGAICYRETIAAPVEGIGHFEPLRHYAEVHLLLEPGGGAAAWSSGRPARRTSWRELAEAGPDPSGGEGAPGGADRLPHYGYEDHPGGGPGPREAHGGRRLPPGHLSGGAPGADGGGEHPAGALVRLPPGAARTSGRPGHDGPPADGGAAVSAGDGGGGGCAHWCRGGVRSGGLRPGGGRHTQGRGRLLCSLRGYAPCADQDAVLASVDYDPTADLDNSPDSVFCSHGAGVIVPWDEVPARAHVSSGLDLGPEKEEPAGRSDTRRASVYAGTIEQDKELQAIFERTYGPVKRRAFIPPKRPPAPCSDSGGRAGKADHPGAVLRTGVPAGGRLQHHFCLG